ncbi:nucleoside recognition domain-containing protein [Paraferrimonas haliotis]|uniref:Membrane protein n=1 Tax=Paraferrimonas haliotis TaxID=2013866 RepID=A0AA37TS28_9GAMM|nr:spore maturation protein [Paraferrimonas haliotis]GLS84638.1 membrane protein [Paraferrimonas haliotis]
MLNRIWFALFGCAAISVALQLVLGQYQVLAEVVAACFSMAKLSAEIALGLVGVLTLWLGLMRLGEASGMVGLFSRLTEPFLSRLMPDVPRGHKAYGSMTMNLTANALGLDNAATPLGLKAMQDLQSLNPSKESATNAQVLFLVLNTSSVTLIPVTIFLYRAQQGAADPADVFLPILLTTCCSTLVGLLMVAWLQKLKLTQTVVLGYLAFAIAAIGALVMYLLTLTAQQIGQVSTIMGNGILLALIFAFVLIAGMKKLPVYELFIEGAKQGFEQSVRLIPYLVAMLLAIGVFRASGALDSVLQALVWLLSPTGMDLRFIDALPTGLMKPFSGSGSRALMLETMQHHGVDSFSGRLAALFQGSTETTFYVLAVYFGSVGLRKGKHAIACGLSADAAGIVAAIVIAYWFYG